MLLAALRKAGIGLLALALCLSLPAQALADEAPALFVNGRQLHPDVPPVIVEGRTLAPLRVIGEALGGDVFWDEKEKRVFVHSADGRVVILKIGEKQAEVRVPKQVKMGDVVVTLQGTFDVRQVTLDVPAQILNGRTLVPLRFLAESLGVEVQWDGETRSVKMTHRGAEQTPETANRTAVERFLAELEAFGKLVNYTAHVVDVRQNDLSHYTWDGRLNHYEGNEAVAKTITLHLPVPKTTSVWKREDRLVAGKVYVKAEGQDAWSVKEGSPEKIRGVLGTPKATALLKADPSLVIWATQVSSPNGFTQFEATAKPDLLEQLGYGSATQNGKIRLTLNIRPEGSVESLHWRYVTFTDVGLEFVSGAVENIVAGNASPVLAPQITQ